MLPGPLAKGRRLIQCVVGVGTTGNSWSSIIGKGNLPNQEATLRRARTLAFSKAWDSGHVGCTGQRTIPVMWDALDSGQSHPST